MRDILGNLFFLDFGERCSWKTTVCFFCCSFWPAQAWLDWWQPIGFLQRAHKLEYSGWRFKRTLVFQFTTIKKDNCNMKRKILKKKFVKCLNIWLSFHYTEKCISLPSFLIDEEKKQLLETEISMAFFLGKWTNVIWNIWNNPSLDFFLFHLSSSSCFYSKLDSWRKTFLYILSIIGFISVFMAGDKMAGHFNWPVPTSPTPTGFVLFFSFSISDILLPVSSCSF